MAERIEVNGYEAFEAFIQQNDEKKLINFYFTCNKDENGVGWCPDCVEAEPHIMSAFEAYAPKDSVFVRVEIGDYLYWKDLNNPFRKGRCTYLTKIPTILRWKHPQRLEGVYYCSKDDLLEMFFTDELDE